MSARVSWIREPVSAILTPLSPIPARLTCQNLRCAREQEHSEAGRYQGNWDSIFPALEYRKKMINLFAFAVWQMLRIS